MIHSWRESEKAMANLEVVELLALNLQLTTSYGLKFQDHQCLLVKLAAFHLEFQGFCESGHY